MHLFIFPLRLLGYSRALSVGALPVFYPGQMERQSVGSLNTPNACFSYYVLQRRVLRYLNLYVSNRRPVRARWLIRHFGCQAYQSYFNLEFGLLDISLLFSPSPIPSNESWVQEVFLGSVNSSILTQISPARRISRTSFPNGRPTFPPIWVTHKPEPQISVWSGRVRVWTEVRNQPSSFLTS